MPDPLIATCELKTASYDLDGNPSSISLVTFTGKKVLAQVIEISGSITFLETRDANSALFIPAVVEADSNIIPPVREPTLTSNNSNVYYKFVSMQPTNGGPAITASSYGSGPQIHYSNQSIPAGSTYTFKITAGLNYYEFSGLYFVFEFYEPNANFSGLVVRQEVAYTLFNQTSCYGFPSSPDTLVTKTSRGIVNAPFVGPGAGPWDEVPKEFPGLTLDGDVNPISSNIAAVVMLSTRTPRNTIVAIAKFSGWAQKVLDPISGPAIFQAQIQKNGADTEVIQINGNTFEPQFFEVEFSYSPNSIPFALITTDFRSLALCTGRWQIWGLEVEVSSVVSGVCSNEGYLSNEIALEWEPAPTITGPGTESVSQFQITDLHKLTEPYPGGWSKNSFGSGIQIHHSIAPFSVPSDGPARLNASLFSLQGLQAYVAISILPSNSGTIISDMVFNPAAYSILEMGFSSGAPYYGDLFQVATKDLSDYLGQTLYVYFRVVKFQTPTSTETVRASDFSLSIDTCEPTPQKDQRLFWDAVGERVYENGVDRGVLYLPDGRAVVWNGLLSVEEDSGSSTQGVFYDGVKISEIVNMGDYSAKLSAITYPDELDDLQGVAQLVEDVYITDQPLKTFGLSYRTRILDDISQEPIGYKIHIVYNVIAVPTDIGYETLSDDPSAMEFQWDLVALSGFIDGFRPTAKFVVDTTKINPDLLIELEKLLYGTSTVQPALPTMQELLEYIRTWYTIQIIDNGDGTWTATSDNDGYIFVDIPQEDQFMITDVNATFLDDETYIISDT
jgi:hypothetical protein